METIQNSLRKENREFIELDGCKPLTKEGKERMKILRHGIEQVGLSAILKKDYF
jgi:hypothetical protein